MFERIKQFKKLSEEIKNLSREREKELGGNVLEICVADDGDFLSPYSPNGSPLISGEIVEFIDHNVNRYKKRLHFRRRKTRLRKRRKKLLSRRIFAGCKGA